MKYISIVYHDHTFSETITDEKLADIIGNVSVWVDDLIESGRHVYSTGLQSPRTASTIRINGGAVSVTDGPFAETKEFLGGFTIFEARDMNEAIQTGSRLAACCTGTVEVRALFDPGYDVSDPDDQRLVRAMRIATERAAK